MNLVHGLTNNSTGTVSFNKDNLNVPQNNIRCRNCEVNIIKSCVQNL